MFEDWYQDFYQLGPTGDVWAWMHPQTGVTILDEDMPWELMPEGVGPSDPA